jgi:uncharacterized membrane protein YphA (DoxX/SURF4 family)
VTRYELVPPVDREPSRERLGWWSHLVERYASADPRSLGLLRVALGAVLLADVAQKLLEVEAHFSNAGWLSNHFALFRPMSERSFSVYFAFGSPGEVRLLMVGHLLVCWLLLVGYRTKLMQVLALILTTSLNSRNIMLETGGSVVLNLLLVWTVFLPLGQRFSVDALRASLAERRETTQAALNDRLEPPRALTPVVSLAVTGLLLQWAAMYFFNAVQKNGGPWRDGTAVHYLLQQERLVTWLGAWLGSALPLPAIKALTYGAWASELTVPVLLLFPFAAHRLRVVAMGLALLLHGSIDCVLQLGSFSWAVMVGFVAFIPGKAWSFARLRLRARRTPCVVHYSPASGAGLALCRLIKRLDVLGLVTFRALDEASPSKAARTLVVSVNGQKPQARFSALVAVAGALWCGSWPLRLLSPLVGRRVNRLLVRMATDPAQLDAAWGTSRLPGEADARSEAPAPARAWLRSLGAPLQQSIVLFVLVSVVSQLLLDNQVVPPALAPQGRPTALEAVIAYPRIFQGWSMFAPSPPLGDGRLVIDGTTIDGRPLDPLTGKGPAFELHPHGEPRHNVLWGTFHARIAEERFHPYWGGLRGFIERHHELSGRPADELARFDAYYLTQAFAAPGEKKKPPERRLLFSSAEAPH